MKKRDITLIRIKAMSLLFFLLVVGFVFPGSTSLMPCQVWLSSGLFLPSYKDGSLTFFLCH